MVRAFGSKLQQTASAAESRKKGQVLGGRLFPLATVEPKSVMSCTSDPDWEEVDFAVDSGASETVVSEDMVTSVVTKPGAASRRGVAYEVANGEVIPNMGEKEIRCLTHEEGVKNIICAQVCDVSKPLLSVHRLVQAGHTVVFGPGGSYIQDGSTGQAMWLRESGGMYNLKLWVPRNPASAGF